MHPFFLITSSDIQSLNDEQARELVTRLCKAELLTKSIATSAVSWGGDQRAPDGGVDVRVDIKSANNISGYVPRSSTIYQVKAESFSAKKIKKEMAPKGKLRTSITELIQQSGAYVIVSTKDNCSDIFLTRRKVAMVESIKKHDPNNVLYLDFYDSRRIADWASNHPIILAWLRTCLNKPLEGWRPYGTWAYHENNIEDEYLLDNKVKVFLPNRDSGIGVTEAINKLREDLSRKQSSVRIVGLSGVGKTRLVQALFDGRIATNNAPLEQGNVLYTDLSDSPSPQPSAMLDALILENSDCVVVIDNCGQDAHKKLTEIVKKPNSKIKLVTVEYDIRDNVPEGTSCYHLMGASKEVISQLLRRHFKKLSELDIDKIVDFSDGNSRVALALASTSESKDQLAHLRDEDLFQRLFLQKHSEDTQLQRSAEVASLLYSFDIDDATEESELATLAAFAEVSIATFYRNVSELQKRGLIQARGKWRAVLPHAIANRLALNAVQSAHQSLLVKLFIINASERVAKSFSRRLGYLHESINAQQIVTSWLSLDGYLGDISKLDDSQWDIFENIAPVNQKAALDAICRSIDKPEFTSTNNKKRARASRLLRLLAYESSLFMSASEGLLKFALKEPKDYKADSACEMLESLFYLYFSGTLASPEQRAAFIAKLIDSQVKENLIVVLKLLGAGLKNDYFSSNYQFDFGALKRDYGWSPKTLKDFNHWYGLFIQIAVDLGKTKTEFSSNARTLLGAALRGLWGNQHLEDLFIEGANELIKNGEWIDGWIGVRNTLKFDKKTLNKVSLEKLLTLEKVISPKSLWEKIQAKVLSRGPFGVDLDDMDDETEPSDWYRRAFDEAKELGKIAALHSDSVLKDLKPFVNRENSNNKVWGFGVGVGIASLSTRSIFEQLRPLFEKTAEQGVDLQFITGLIDGWNQSRPQEVTVFLDEALEDAVWGPIFPYLQFSVTLDQSAYLRLLKSMELNLAPAWSYSGLGTGRRTDTLSVVQISNLLTQLSTKSNEGVSAAIDVLYMVRYCTDTKDEQYKDELREYCLDWISNFDWNLIDKSNDNITYHLAKIIEFALQSAKPEKLAIKALNNLMERELTSKYAFIPRVGQLLVPFLERCPHDALDIIYAKGDTYTLKRMLTLSLVRHAETALYSVPEQALIEWCSVSPEDRFIFAANACQLFDRDNLSDLSYESVTGIASVAKKIFALAPDKKRVLEIFVSRLQPTSWSGSRAAIMRQRANFLDQFNPTSNLEFKALVEIEKEKLSSLIDRIELHELEEERSESSSFE